MLPEPATILSTIPIAYIVSHYGFARKIYGGPQITQFIFSNDLNFSSLYIDFVHFDIGSADTCITEDFSDAFAIISNLNINAPVYICGDRGNLPPSLVLDMASSEYLKLCFRSDAKNVHSGILLRYSGNV